MEGNYPDAVGLEPGVSTTKLGGAEAVRLQGENWTALCSADPSTQNFVALFVPPVDGVQPDWAGKVIGQLQKGWHWAS